MLKHILGAASVVVFVSGCVREISSEERLERETRGEDRRHGDALAEVTALRCDDAPGELTKAQDERRPEEERLALLGALYESLRSRNDKYDEAFARNTDLAYRSGNDAILVQREQCVRSQADARVALESFLRDVLQMPIVDEVRGSRKTRVPRMNFAVVRKAIGQLAPDDAEQLLQRLTDAERDLGIKIEEPPPPAPEPAAAAPEGASDAAAPAAAAPAPAAGAEGEDEARRPDRRRRRPATR